MAIIKSSDSNAVERKLDEVIELLQLSNCINLYLAGVNQGAIAQTLGVSKTKINKKLLAVPKKEGKR